MSKTPPYGITKEAWDATKKLREYYTKVNNLINLHLHEKHGWGGLCECPEMLDSYTTLDYISSDIKRALYPPPPHDPYKLKRLEHELMALLRSAPNPLIDRSLISKILVKEDDLNLIGVTHE